MGTSAWRFLEISAGSMSQWMTVASGANASSRPVTRSSKRAPTVTRTSALLSAQFAYFEPCIPGMRRARGCESGNAPLAMSVVTTGMDAASARARSSSSAPALVTPPPTYRTGRSDSAMTSAARSTWSGWPSRVGR